MHDVIVVGLGAMGSATAYQLAGRGKRVLGLEQYSAAHDKGSSHGRSRIIRQAYFEDPSYVPLILRAYELWEQLQEKTGQELIALTGGLTLGKPDSDVIKGSVRSAEDNALRYELLETADIREHFPLVAPASGMVGFYEHRTGVVRPEATVKAHLEQAAAAGAELHFEEPVLSWEASDSGDHVRVQTSQGVYEAESLVMAPGSWAPELLADLDLPLEIERQIMYWFEPAGAIEAFEPGQFPMFICEPEDGNKFACWPRLDNERGVKVTFFHAGGSPCTPGTLDRQVSTEEVNFIKRYLTEYVPTAAGTCLEALTCMYTNTPDLNFVISSHPRHSQVTIAAGFSGHGYKFASVIGEILADLTDEGSTKHPIELFSPTRFGNKISARKL